MGEDAGMKIVVNDIPPSNNKFLGRSVPPVVYQTLKREWHWKIKEAISKRPKEPFKKAVIRIIYYFKDSRRRDPDNYSGKFILDALVSEKVIADDSFNVISLWLYGDMDKDNPRTEIEVLEDA